MGRPLAALLSNVEDVTASSAFAALIVGARHDSVIAAIVLTDEGRMPDRRGQLPWPDVGVSSAERRSMLAEPGPTPGSSA